jgi:hypothetical protein
MRISVEPMHMTRPSGTSSTGEKELQQPCTGKLECASFFSLLEQMITGVTSVLADGFEATVLGV